MNFCDIRKENDRGNQTDFDFVSSIQLAVWLRKQSQKFKRSRKFRFFVILNTLFVRCAVRLFETLIDFSLLFAPRVQFFCGGPSGESKTAKCLKRIFEKELFFLSGEFQFFFRKNCLCVIRVLNNLHCPWWHQATNDQRKCGRKILWWVSLTNLSNKTFFVSLAPLNQQICFEIFKISN